MIPFDCIGVRRKPFGDRHHGLMQAGGRVLPCALGRAGPSVFKREGDGATPARTVMRPLWGYFRQDRVARPQALLPFGAIKANDGWCDESGHAAYNSPVRLPFAGSHETMMRDDCLYDICVVLDFNMAPHGRMRGKGSAIFLHCAKPGYRPTAGCIALDRPDLQWLLLHVDERTRFLVDV